MVQQLVRKAQPTASDVHVNRPLTNVSVAYMQKTEDFVADQVFPIIRSDKQSDTYFEYDRSYWFRNEMKKVAEGARTEEMGYKIATNPFLCDVWGLHLSISDRSRANADEAVNRDQEATNILTMQGLINREIAWGTAFFTTGVWTTDVTGVTGAPSAGQFRVWNDYTNSTPISDIETGKETVKKNTGMRPNTLVLGYTAWKDLKNHPTIVDRVKYGQVPGSPAVVSKNTVAAVFELERILVSEAIQTTSAEGAATATYGFIAGDNALLCYVPPSAGKYTPSAGYTFAWTGLFGASAYGTRINRMRDDLAKSDWIEIESAYQQKKIAADLGYFFSNTNG